MKVVMCFLTRHLTARTDGDWNGRAVAAALVAAGLWVAVVMAVFFGAAARAANVWSSKTCTVASPCKLTFDTAGQADPVRTWCPGGVFVERGSADSGSVHVYSSVSETFSDANRARALTSDGVEVDVTLDSSTSRACGLPGFFWFVDVQSGTGSVLVGCGGCE